MTTGLRLEIRRKAIQALGLAFVPFGRLGAGVLALLIAVELAHLARAEHGGLPGWGEVRRMGRRGGGSPAGRDFGPMFLALGIAVVLVSVRGPWAWAIVCQPCLADSAAALAGMLVGGPRWPGSRKTVAGSAAFVAVAAMAAATAGVPLPVSLLLAGLGATVEVHAPFGSDNLLLPLAGLGLRRLVA